MCELFGISSREKIHCNILLRTFFSHSVNHPDGWGLASFHDGGASIEKEPLSAAESAYLRARLKDNISEDVLLAHIRKASVGNLSYQNTHPFALRDGQGCLWTLIHNGTIFESPLLEPYRQFQKGSTDSERILYYLVEQINHGRGSSLSRCAIIEEAVCAIAPKNKVNLLIYDGSLLYIHCNHRGSLYLWQRPETVVVSTQPLNQASWMEVPLNTLLAYRQGKLVYTGKPHSHEYVKPDDGEPPLFPELMDGLGI